MTGAALRQHRHHGSDRLEVGRGRLALLTALHVEADLLALVQRAKTGPLDGRDVNEHILRPVIGLDEPEAFFCVEPFDSAL